MKKIKLIPLAIFFSIFFGLSSYAEARETASMSANLAEAMDRSNNEQRDIRNAMVKQHNERIDSWAERGQETIQIRHTGGGTLPMMDLGDPDFDIDDSGEDQSGLDGLRSTIEEEPTDIDFGDELREVSSIIDEVPES